MSEKAVLTVLTGLYSIVLVRWFSGLSEQVAQGIEIAAIAGTLGYLAGNKELSEPIKALFVAARVEPWMGVLFLLFYGFIAYTMWLFLVFCVAIYLAWILAWKTVEGYAILVNFVRSSR